MRSGWCRCLGLGRGLAGMLLLGMALPAAAAAAAEAGLAAPAAAGAAATGPMPAGPAPAGSAALGPSFDCGRATRAIEKVICSDAGLAAEDRRLAEVFAEARREKEEPIATDGVSLLDEQRKWLAERDECADDDAVRCLLGRYHSRAMELWAAMPFVLHVRVPLKAADEERLIGLFHWMSADDLNTVTQDDNDEALSAASCRFFERFPREAEVVFAANSYSSRDAWTPICHTIDVAERLPAMDRLVHLLASIEAGSRECGGTIYYGHQRDQLVTRILAVVDVHPDLAAYDQERRHDAADEEKELGYHPDVAHWGLQGLWQKRRYAELRRAVAVARPALAADYQKRFGLAAAAADRVADYYIGKLTDKYTRISGASSTLEYYSLCYTRQDLDGYLRSGKMPARECPYHEDAEPGRPAALRRLLGLAIVNDYPLAVVKRLLAAGASVNPPAPPAQRESRESLLMLAAARADVIGVLLGAGANPNAANAFGKTALMYAAQERNAAGVRRLLAAGAEVDAATTTMEFCGPHITGRTALMYAARRGAPEVVRMLLAAHADAGRSDSAGRNAAAHAAANRSLAPAERQKLVAMLAVPGAGKP